MKRGFSLIEVVISFAFVILLVLGFSFFSKNSRSSMQTMFNKNFCTETVTNIVSTIEALDNSLIVRSWLPSATSLRSPASPQDPYCNSVSGRTPVCDTLDVFSLVGGFVNLATINNSQNLRSAGTWAQSVYNMNRPAICTSPGLTLSPTDLNNLLPRPIAFPPEITTVNLAIGDTKLPCGSLSTFRPNTSQSFEIIVRANYLNTKVNQPDSCMTSTVAGFLSDSEVPVTQIVMRNGDGDIIPNNACTCRRTVPAMGGNGGPCGSFNDVTYTLSSSEQGTLFLCNRSGPAGNIDPAGSFRSCSNLQFLGATTTVTNAGPVYNGPLNAQVTLSNLPEQLGFGDPYVVNIREYDTNNNTSPIVTPARFVVKKPVCPNPNTYCVNQTPPLDDCRNGLCPPGTRVPVCPPAGSVCAGRPLVDSCGQNCGAGIMPGSGCPDPNTFCGAPNPASDNCNNACAIGISCAGPFPTPTPTPAATTICAAGGACVGGGVVCLTPGSSMSLPINTSWNGGPPKWPAPLPAAGWGAIFPLGRLGYVPVSWPFTCFASAGTNVLSVQNTAGGKICEVLFNYNLLGPQTGSGNVTLTVDAAAPPGPTIYNFGELCNQSSGPWNCTWSDPDVQVQIVCP